MTSIPTINELYTSLVTSVESELNITLSLFGKSYIRAKCMVHAAKLKLIYLLLAKVQKNIFADTAEPVSMGGTLERFGYVKLGRGPFPAVAGEYTVTVTGTTGATITAQTTFKSDDDSSSPGYLYQLDTEFTFSGSSGSITLRALSAGLVSELAVSDTLTATAPIANVDRSATVTAISVEPQAAEDTETYRERIVQSFRLEPQGGAVSDYRLWALDAQGVANAYPYSASADGGIIDLYVEATIQDSTDGKGTPSSALLDDVESVVELDPDTTLPINERGRRPLGVSQVNYNAVVVVDVDITITGGSFTSEQEGLIEAALEDEIATVRPYIAGADVLADRNDVLNENKVVYVIQDTINNAQFTSVSIDFDSSTLSTYTFDDGEIPYLNSVTFS